MTRRTQMEREDMRSGVPNSWGDERRGWTIDKTIPVTTIFSTIGVIIGGVIWASGMENRIAQMEVQRREDIQRQEVDRKELKEDVRDTNAKIDRVLELVSRKE